MSQFISTGDATSILPVPDSSVSPITVIATEEIRNGFDEFCVKQAINCHLAPGVTDVVLTPMRTPGIARPSAA